MVASGADGGGKAAGEMRIVGLAAVVVGMRLRTEIGKAMVAMEVGTLVAAAAIGLGKIGIGTIAGETEVGGDQSRGITVVVGRGRVSLETRLLRLILLVGRAGRESGPQERKLARRDLQAQRSPSLPHAALPWTTKPQSGRAAVRLPACTAVRKAVRASTQRGYSLPWMARFQRYSIWRFFKNG